ncbi:MAG: hypothetical protein FJ137_17165 [Deltaproteobacteria bacterium]|nr:hypothetical protein [Deltaproteobacteria bacterium]
MSLLFRSPRQHARVVGALACLIAAVACGRSAEPTYACPAVGDDCATIAATQTAAEAAYARAADAKDGAAMDEAAECVQLQVSAAVAGSSNADDGSCVDRCAELCRLHPCDVLAVDGAALECPARCDALRGDGAFDDDDLDLALFKAAENPGFCTCRACTAFDDALCTQLFDCAPATE